MPVPPKLPESQYSCLSTLVLSSKMWTSFKRKVLYSSYSSGMEVTATALREAAPYFSAETAASIAMTALVGPGHEHVARHLIDSVEATLTRHNDNTTSRFAKTYFPHSVDDFLVTVLPAFSEQYVAAFAENCRRFERLVGGSVGPSFVVLAFSHEVPAHQPTELSNAFIRTKTVQAWIEQICFDIARHCFNLVVKRGPVSRFLIPFLCNTPRAPKPLPVASGSQMTHGDMFQQITLVGPTLFEAWNRFPFTRSLEDASDRGDEWTPARECVVPVYHGTAAHLGKRCNSSNYICNPYENEFSSASEGEMTSTYRIPGSVAISTSFSPFRAFTQAVFEAEVFRTPPILTETDSLCRAWTYDDKTYEGVLLVQFSAPLPGPDGCNTHIVAQGQEETWIANARDANVSGDSLQDWWSRFSIFHKQPSGSRWPDVIHGLENSSARAVLRAYTKQAWRSVWTGSGIEMLKAHHTQTLAIRYIVRPEEYDMPWLLLDDSSLEKGQDGSKKKSNGFMAEIRNRLRCW